MSAEQWIVVPNWDRFQHYSDRDPPWIKTYPALLNDDAYLDLSLATRGFLHGVWLLYARSRGVLSVSQARRVLVVSASDARRVRDNLESLNRAGFIEVSASRPLPFRYSRDRDRGRDRGREDSPLPPAERGIENGTPRTRGTNPRAVAQRSREDRHESMLIDAWERSAHWEETRTDLMHERLDEIEQEHDAILTDQEREQIIDSRLERAR